MAAGNVIIVSWSAKTNIMTLLQHRVVVVVMYGTITSQLPSHTDVLLSHFKIMSTLFYIQVSAPEQHLACGYTCKSMKDGWRSVGDIRQTNYTQKISILMYARLLLLDFYVFYFKLLVCFGKDHQNENTFFQSFNEMMARR